MSARKWWPERGMDAPIRTLGFSTSAMVGDCIASPRARWEAGGQSEIFGDVTVALREFLLPQQAEAQRGGRGRGEQVVGLGARTQRPIEQPAQRLQQVLAHHGRALFRRTLEARLEAFTELAELLRAQQGQAQLVVVVQMAVAFDDRVAFGLAAQDPGEARDDGVAA